MDYCFSCSEGIKFDHKGKNIFCAVLFECCLELVKDFII